MANTLRAVCIMKVDLHLVREPLLQAVPKAVATMDAHAVQNTLRALVGMKLGKWGWGQVQDCLLEALARIAPDLSATGVANVVYSLRTKRKDLGVAHVPLIEAFGRVADEFSAQDVSKALISCAYFKLDQGDAAGLLMESVARAAEESMNAFQVAKTLHAVGMLRLPPGPAQVPLMQAFVRVSPDLKRIHLTQVRKGLERLQTNDPDSEVTQAAMSALEKTELRLLGQKQLPSPVFRGVIHGCLCMVSI